MTKFNVGDTVVCLDDYYDQFTAGKHYTVTDLSGWGIRVIDDRGQANGWQYEHFDLVDMVNSPPHYTQYTGFEVIDIVEQLPYLKGTAVKYIMRAGDKWDEKQDIEKAIWYLQRQLSKLG